MAAGKMRPATEAAKKDPSRGGSGQEVRPSFAVNRGIMTNEIQFVTNLCCIAKIKESAVLCRMLRIGHTAAYWERTRCEKSTDVTVYAKAF